MWKEFSHVKTQCTDPSSGGQNKTFLGDFFPPSPVKPDSMPMVASVLLMHKVLLGRGG